MRRIAKIALLGLATTLTIGTAPKYAEGQIWSYKTRPQDAGSLLRIEKIETTNGIPTYHLMVIGVHLSNPQKAPVLPHVPVSERTLDISVTHRARSTVEWPVAGLQAGVAEWRKASGGVFSVSMSEIIEQVDGQTKVAS